MISSLAAAEELQAGCLGKPAKMAIKITLEQTIAGDSISQGLPMNVVFTLSTKLSKRRSCSAKQALEFQRLAQMLSCVLHRKC